MAALAGVGSYGAVFHTKTARSSRRACNFIIPKGECAPAIFSIPIARSTFLPMLANAELVVDFDASIATDSLGRLTEAAQERLTHSPAIRKTCFPSNHINRVARLFHHQASCFKAEVLNGFRG